MKRLYLLPGNDPKNLYWIKQIAEKIGAGFDNINIQEYDHWKTGEPVINWETEYQKLVAKFSDNIGADDLTMFGKSAGTLLTLLGIHRKLFTPKYIVMCGLPITWGYKQGLHMDEMLSELLNLKTQVLIIQQENDRVGTAQFTKNALLSKGFKVGKSFEFLSIPGSDHAYSEFGDYIPFVVNFLNNVSNE
jgi:hypothetical protein